MIGSKLALIKELSFSKQKSQFSERTIKTTFVRRHQINSITPWGDKRVGYNQYLNCRRDSSPHRD